jgi:hypothetical protein
MRRKVFAIAAIFAFVLALRAQDPKTTTVEGNIIDNACAGSHSKEATFGDRVKKHSTSCALMPPCVKSGYAVFTADSKLYKLDKAGNDAVEALLRATDTKAGVAVVVEGTIDGDTIKATKVTEKTQ